MNDIMISRITSHLTPTEVIVLLRSFYEFIEGKYGFEYATGFISVQDRFKKDLVEYAEEEGLKKFLS